MHTMDTIVFLNPDKYDSMIRETLNILIKMLSWPIQTYNIQKIVRMNYAT